MERFDPRLASQVPGSEWVPGPTARPNRGFGERAIGELVQAIVARLSRGAPCSTGSN